MWGANIGPGFPATGASDNTYELLPTPEAFLADLMAEITADPLSVDLQFYTFENDAIGRPLAEALMSAHTGGSAIRLMVDHYINLAHNDRYIRVPRFNRSLRRSIVSEWRGTNRLLDGMKQHGIGVKMINPLGFLHRRALRRDHKKLVIIRRRYPLKPVAYIGGIQPSEHNAAWHDFMVKMSGDMVPILEDDFEQTWQEINAGGITPFSDGAVLTDGFGQSVIIPAAQSLINQARKRIVIQSAYLWGRDTIGALIAAPERNVDVSVIVPLHNHKKVGTPSERVLHRMGNAGIHVYRYAATGGMSHARALLADDYGLFGSNTFNAILAGRMREIGIVTDNDSLVTQLGQFLAESVNNSQRQYN